MSRGQSFHQLSFLPKIRMDHGGDIGSGKRKIARPFDPKQAMHIVLRSSRARGHWSFLAKAHKDRVRRLIHRAADRDGVRIYRYANVGNHLHLLIRAKKRRDLQNFLRVISGRIACLVTGAKKTGAMGQFWDRLAYSRIVSFGREFRSVHAYLIKNLFEAAGLWDRKRYSELDPFFSSLIRAEVSPPG